MPTQPPTEGENPCGTDDNPRVPPVVGGADYGEDLEAWALGLDDTLATQESNALASEDDLEKVERKNDHTRMESLRDSVYELAGWFLRLSGGLLTVGILFWAWHLLLPEVLWFLSAEQLDRIQVILTTVLFSGLVGGYARRVMESKNGSSRS
ncbi:TPA: hypothetical protein ACOEQV_000866 [Stenotrophomonas maltophilia]|uniref:hypothetical protein n=1 Tax=Stenotrophomonas maltophilia TaxID=40324 RepID=UPI0013DCEBCE|nr:hypothetical protein [Stenotrophomonas maltophilia]